MVLFKNEELVNVLTALKVKKSIYDYVIYESDVEREFARKLDQREDIRLFVKLPDWFKVETPVGTYNPDWAIVKHHDETVYLVRETKGTKDFLKLRTMEADKVRCGQRHFEALGVPFAVATTAEYMNECTRFIRHVAPGSWPDYADELRDGGNKLKQDIMGKMDRENSMAAAIPQHSTRVQLRNDLDAALDQLIKRKVEDFEWGYMEGKDMNATTQNTVNIINSSISNSVVQITQSGKDAISKDTALKLQELVNSEEIKGLPDDDRLEVLDRVSDLIEELSDEKTDKDKVHRGLNRLGKFIWSCRGVGWN
jgi:hypothetical protein